MARERGIRVFLAISGRIGEAGLLDVAAFAAQKAVLGAARFEGGAHHGALIGALAGERAAVGVGRACVRAIAAGHLIEAFCGAAQHRLIEPRVALVGLGAGRAGVRTGPAAATGRAAAAAVQGRAGGPDSVAEW